MSPNEFNKKILKNDLRKLVYKGCWNLRGWVVHSYHLPSVCSDAWDRKDCQERAMSGPQKWICLKQKIASDSPFSPTKGFMFSYTKRSRQHGIRLRWNMSSAAFLAKHARLQNVSMSQKGMK